MPARVEPQKAMALDPRPHLIEGFRAVCEDHGFDDTGLIPEWMAPLHRTLWFDAAFDALEHNLAVHSSEGHDGQNAQDVRELQEG